MSQVAAAESAGSPPQRRSLRLTVEDSGLKTILRANDYCKNHHIPVTVIKPRGLASRVFILTRVHLELDLVDSPASDHTT